MTEEVTTKVVQKEITGIEEPESEKEDNSDDEKLYQSASEQLHSLPAEKASLERYGQLNKVCKKAIYECQRALRLEK